MEKLKLKKLFAVLVDTLKDSSPKPTQNVTVVDVVTPEHVLQCSLLV